METVVCDFCGTEKSEEIAHQTDKLHRVTNEVFIIVRCANCGLHFTNPRPTRVEIGRYYSQEYSFHGAPSTWKRMARRSAELVANGPLGLLAGLFPPLGRRLVPHVRPDIRDPVREYFVAGGKGALLDIGCGAGATAHFWGESGSLLAYRDLTVVAGVEVAVRARVTLSAHGIESWSDLDEVPPERKFGIIRMNWSLEHVHSPTQYFTFIRDRLLPGGRAVIAVPNYGGLIYRLAPDCVELPIHLFHFRPQDLENYSARHGLRIQSLRTFSYPHMFAAAADAGMLPGSFSFPDGLPAARAMLEALQPFDRANWGNDMIAVLACDA